MSFANDIKKLFSGKHSWLFLAVILVLGLAIGHYSFNKGLLGESMTGTGAMRSNVADSQRNEMPTGQELTSGQAGQNVQAAAPLGANGGFAQVSGMNSGSNQGMPSSCTPQSMPDPAALLPSDSNSAWNSLNPSPGGALDGVNLLKAGYHIGIDTVGQSLRNANLQVRSEPANPQINVGPWNNTTIEPDVMRVPLQIGQGPQ